jgi:hypothetical protein
MTTIMRQERIRTEGSAIDDTLDPTTHDATAVIISDTINCICSQLALITGEVGWENAPAISLITANTTLSTIISDVSSLQGDVSSLITSVGLIQDYAIDSGQPNGVIDITESTISFVNGTRTFTIQPVVASFSYYSQGVKHTKNGAESIVLTNTTGLHYIYYDGATLMSGVNLTVAQIRELIIGRVLLAIIYWNSTYSSAMYFGEERHGILMDGKTHYNLHISEGTRYVSGCTLNSLLVDQNGDSNTHAQWGYDTSRILDEDLGIDLAAVLSTIGVPILYKLGASAQWVRANNPGFSLLTTGSGRAAYNQYTLGAWQLTEITNNNFCLYHIFAVNDVGSGFIAVMGEHDYVNINAARDGAVTEISSLSRGGLPFTEFIAVGTVIIQTSNSYSNAVKSRVRSTGSGDYIDWRFSKINPSGFSPSDHNNLSGIQGGTSNEYYHTTQVENAAVVRLATGTIQGPGNTSATNTILCENSVGADEFIVKDDGGVHVPLLKFGATAIAAGAVAGELWLTSGHATLPDGVVMRA